jgi:hypothetical protein
VRTGGPPHVFVEREWSDVIARYEELDFGQRFEHMSAIARSVHDAQKTDQLAVAHSMFDLYATAKPVSEPPVDVVQVLSPSSVPPHRPGT